MDSEARHRQLLAQERSRLEVTPGPSTWRRFCPHDLWDDSLLSACEGYLDEQPTRDELESCEREERYPIQAVEGLRRLGLHRLLCDDAEGSLLTAWHLGALNTITARRDTSLAISVGVNALSLLPAWIAATPDQLAWISERVRQGAASSMLLTELEHGSNLLRTTASAVPGVLVDGEFEPRPEPAGCTHWRLSGEKHLINGGIEHQLRIAIIRTGQKAADPKRFFRDRGSFSVFLLEQDDGMISLPRWRTLPARGADISGVVFSDTVVPADRILGEEGSGFKLIKHTLSVSRGGIAALASGTASQARDLACAYAARRDVYGAPIKSLAAVAHHLLKLEALERAVAAVSLRAAVCVNAWGLGASHYTAVAKLAGCALAEEAVCEGRIVLGGRALLEDLPYTRLIRDVLLYGVFDGTSHVMLEELSGNLSDEVYRWTGRGEGRVDDSLAEVRSACAAPPAPLVEVLRRGQPAMVLPLPEHLRALAELPGSVSLEPLVELANALYAAVRDLRSSDGWTQANRFEAAWCVAFLESVVALVELTDPDRRPALGMTPVQEPEPVVYRYAVGWLGSRVAARLRFLLAANGLETSALQGLEERLLAGAARVRTEHAAGL